MHVPVANVEHVVIDVSIQFGPGWLCFDFELVSPSIGSYFFVTG
jgi:hypothetical protein